MIERITQSMTTEQILANINQADQQMANTEQELSSGLSINQPSDNPYGASLAISLNQQLAGLTTYSNNVTDGTAWASAADTSMQSIANMVQRVQELVTEAANGTESASDRAAAGAEVNQLIESIKQSANTQYDGQYIFSGSASGTEPYPSSTDVYQGNTDQVVRQIGPGSSLAVNADLSSVLGSGQTANNGQGDGGLLDTLRTIASDLDGTGNANDLGTSDLQNLQNNLNSLETVQAQIGGVENRLTLASSQITDLQNTDTQSLSNDEDVNMATAMTSYSNESAAYQAALKAGADIVQSSLMDFLNNS